MTKTIDDYGSMGLEPDTPSGRSVSKRKIETGTLILPWVDSQ